MEQRSQDNVPPLPLRDAARTQPWLPPWALQQQEKEDSRMFRRTVYNFDRWHKHRSTDRYAENMLSIPNSRILSSLGSPILKLSAFSATFCAYESALELHLLPVWMPSFCLSSPEPQVLTSFALSLLLVFRTNSSYARFDEARKLWGGVMNRARNITQQAVTLLPDSEAVSKAALGRWTVAFSRSLAAHVQEEHDLHSELQPLMLPQELDMLMGSQSRPIKCLNVLAEVLQQADLTPWQRIMFQTDVTFFYDVLGNCERILKTPIPLSYTRHTCRFLIVWLTALPLGLWEDCRWAVVPITAAIALLLLGIEEIGVQIEEPFGILPLDAICEGVEANVRDLLQSGDGVRQFVRDLHVQAAAMSSTDASDSDPISLQGGGRRGPGGGSGGGVPMVAMAQALEVGGGRVGGTPTVALLLKPTRSSSGGSGGEGSGQAT